MKENMITFFRRRKLDTIAVEPVQVATPIRLTYYLATQKGFLTKYSESFNNEHHESVMQPVFSRDARAAKVFTSFAEADAEGTALIKSRQIRYYAIVSPSPY